MSNNLHPIGALYTVDARLDDGKRWRITYKVIDHTLLNGVLVEQTERVAQVLLEDPTGPSERK